MKIADIVSVIMEFNSETERSIRFDEVGGSEIFGSLYIKKWAWEKMDRPKFIEIMVIPRIVRK